MVASDTIVISKAERLLMEQYSKSLEKMHATQVQLLATKDRILRSDLDEIGIQRAIQSYRLSMDTTFAVQSSVYDALEARLQHIHRDDTGEFIGLDNLHKLYETRLLLTGHTL